MLHGLESKIQRGTPYPLGATVMEGGTNFSVFSKNAQAIELLLFEHEEAKKPYRVVSFHPKQNKTFYYWHIFLENIGHGQVYAYRVYGKYDPSSGDMFDSSKVLIDPYSKKVSSLLYDREAAKKYGVDNCATSMRSIVIDPKRYDWEGDKPLCRPYSNTVIYEMHVSGFTKNPNSGVADDIRGSYLGVIEKIPYLKELGITAVELLPVQQFDKYDAPKGLTNYWGYSPICFFAPHNGYVSKRAGACPVNEFRDMVKAFHKAGIEVILDVVYNHTAEMGADGPTLSWRGFENKAYYIMDDDYRYLDFSGCGNTFNANHSIARRMIMNSLRYWVREMHVDGFRFDLASILSRGESGQPMENPPILWEIESDPVLAGTKIIAEAWDAGGLYQVGNFIGDKWGEWNGKYRDDIRRFVKGDEGMINPLAIRMEGSPDMYWDPRRDPNRSINFITCHDGFTLNDLVSYNQKHNEANCEGNRDGSNENYSWNCGVEGPTNNPAIEALRLRQIKNFFAILFLSQGTPMFMMGDEVRRTQRGNNNAYCQDNEIGWFNWDDVQKNQGLFRFVKKLIQFNLNHRLLQENYYWHITRDDDTQRIHWHGVKLNHPDWGWHSHSIAFLLTDKEDKEQVYVMINAYWEKLTFEIPYPEPTIGKEWVRVIDTSLPSPNDFIDVEKAPPYRSSTYTVSPRTVVMLQVK